MLKFESTALFVSDMDVSKKFYCELLGMKTVIDMGGNVILENGLTLWQIQKDHIITRTLGQDRMNRGNQFEVYFETDNLEGVLETLRQWAIQFLHEIHEEPWGQKTIRFYDPDRNIVEIGESMQTFFDRMNKSGMSIEEIAKKNGMSPGEVARIIKG